MAGQGEDPAACASRRRLGRRRRRRHRHLARSPRPSRPIWAGASSCAAAVAVGAAAADDAPAERAASARAPSSTPSAKPDAEKTARCRRSFRRGRRGTIHNFLTSTIYTIAAPAPSGGGGGLLRLWPHRARRAGVASRVGRRQRQRPTPRRRRPGREAVHGGAWPSRDETGSSRSCVGRMRWSSPRAESELVPIPPGAKAPHHDAAASRETRLTRDLPPCGHARDAAMYPLTPALPSRRSRVVRQSWARAARSTARTASLYD